VFPGFAGLSESFETFKITYIRLFSFFYLGATERELSVQFYFVKRAEIDSRGAEQSMYCIQS